MTKTLTNYRTAYKTVAADALRKHAHQGLTILSFNALCGDVIDNSDGEIQGTPSDYVVIAKMVRAQLTAGTVDPAGPAEWDAGCAAEMQMARAQARQAAK